MDANSVIHLLEASFTQNLTWTAQGFGFLRLRLHDNQRLHIWDSSLRTPGVSDIHDHAQWAFKSTVISGEIVNHIFLEEYPYDEGFWCMTANIVAGQEGKMVMSSVRQTKLIPVDPYVVPAGGSYAQEPHEIHRTEALDGTITILDQLRTDTNEARVFWPMYQEWVPAFPRIATPEEVQRVVSNALKLL